MSHKDWSVYALLAIVAFTLLVRLSLAGDSPLSFDSYALVRDVEHIQATGLPLTDDPLSMTGHERIGSPLFSYLLALLTLLSPFIYVLLPNLATAALPIPVYLLARRLGDTTTALLAALLAATSPILFSSYLITPSAVPIAVFLILMILVYLHEPERHIIGLTLFAILLAFLSPLIFVVAGALLITVILLRMESFGVDRRIGELFLFTFLLAVWYYVIIYKRALFAHGIAILWQNLPAAYASLAFGSITFLDALYAIGVIGFLFGMVGSYHALFEERNRTSFVILATILSTSILLVLRLIPIAIGLFLLAPLLAAMAGHGLRTSFDYLRRTRTPWIVYPAGVAILLLFFFSSVVPAFVDAQDTLRDAPTFEEIATYRALNLPAGAVLLTMPHEAPAVQYYAGVIALSDDYFLMTEHGDELLQDIDTVYTARFSSQIVNNARKWGFTHILFTRTSAIHYGRTGIFAEGTCLSTVPLGAQMGLTAVTCIESEAALARGAP